MMVDAWLSGRGDERSSFVSFFSPLFFFLRCILPFDNFLVCENGPGLGMEFRVGRFEVLGLGWKLDGAPGNLQYISNSRVESTS